MIKCIGIVLYKAFEFIFADFLIFFYIESKLNSTTNYLNKLLYHFFMKILLIGNGAREHVIAETLKKNKTTILYSYLK